MGYSFFDFCKEQGAETRSAIRIAHRIHDGIIQAADSEKASLVLMGWKGYTSTRDRILGEVADRVVRLVSCDLIFVKLLGDRPIRRILVSTAGGPHATLAAEFVGVYRQVYGYHVTCCYVVGPHADDHERHTARQWIQKTIQFTGLREQAQIRLLEGKRVAGALVKAAADYDLTVLGASREGIFSSVLFGEIPEKVARYSQSPVMIVKRYEGPVKSIIKRIMG